MPQASPSSKKRGSRKAGSRNAGTRPASTPLRTCGSFNVSTLLPDRRYITSWLPVLALCLVSCGEGGAGEKKVPDPAAPKQEQYLGLSPEAKYVGMQTCRSCHENIYRTFIN